MKYALSVAPTQNYLEMTKQSEKETEKIIKNFKNVESQCGIAVFINGEFIGIEFYANPLVWNTMSKDILKAFAIESLRFKEKAERKITGYHEEFLKILAELNFKYSTKEGVALGNVVEFDSVDKKWRGITLVHNGKFAQFYLVSKRGGYQEKPHSNVQFQTVVDQRYTI
jgi:hypothetical protein